MASFFDGWMPLAQLPAEIKEPGFAQWVVYLLVLIYVIEKIGGGVLRLMGKEMPAKREISGRIVSLEEEKFAPLATVEVLAKGLADAREENQTQHRAAREAGERRVVALSEVIETKTKEIEREIDDMREGVERKLEDGFNRMSHKLEAVMIQVARHEEALPHLRDKIDGLTVRYNDSIPNIHKRIDAVMKAARCPQ